VVKQTAKGICIIGAKGDTGGGVGEEGEETSKDANRGEKNNPRGKVTGDRPPLSVLKNHRETSNGKKRC